MHARKDIIQQVTEPILDLLNILFYRTANNINECYDRRLRLIHRVSDKEIEEKATEYANNKDKRYKVS